VVNYHGSGLEFSAEHLSALVDQSLIKNLKETFQCPVNLINDADCALIGAVENGLVNEDGAHGLMVVGTGLGSVTTENHSLNDIVSASILASHSATKLICRATNILQELFGCDSKDALEILKNHNYSLLKAVQTSISTPCSPTEKLP